MIESMVNEVVIDAIVEEIEKRLKGRDEPLIVAIDGKSGVGKTEISKRVADKLGGINVRCDDFFIGGDNNYWAKQSREKQINEVISWKRIKEQVIVPLKNRKKASWHPFNWREFKGLSPEAVTVHPKDVVVLDGAFSNRPELRDMVDFSVFVEVPKREIRVGRVKEREGDEYSDDWHKTWEDAMEYYFEKISPPETFDLIVRN